MSYTIGQVSKLLNIPVETIRYYEFEGLVHPFKNPDNGYRYYGAWDVNFMLEYKKYRSIEFKQQDILSIQQTDTVGDVLCRMRMKENEIENKIKYYQLLKKKVSEINSDISGIDKHLNKYTLCRPPVLHYIVNRMDYDYDMSSSEMFAKWIDAYPFVENTLLIENKKINWCFSIEDKWAEALGFDVTGLRTFESEKALCTIIKSSSGCFAHNVYKNIRQYTDSAGYTVLGNIMGHLLLRAHENGDFVRYMKLWIPIK